MLTGKLRWWLSQLRYRIRRRQWVTAASYMSANCFHAVMHQRPLPVHHADNAPSGRLAVCLRFRDEARFLEEWLDYHLAAGVDHFFLYNNFSADEYQEILQPYQERKVVTLIDWPCIPASPTAEQDCLARTRGRFRWVGFIDADEFVVVRDGRSLSAFLDEFCDAPGVALHWYYFGSNGHDRRPEDWVIRAYTRRDAHPNHHFKVFVRPDEAIRCRNSHNFYYSRARCAIREDGRRVFGSLASPATAARAWINHYYCKSLQDYMEKAARRSTLDQSGIREPSRQVANARLAAGTANDVVDFCAINYFEARRDALRSTTTQDPSP